MSIKNKWVAAGVAVIVVTSVLAGALHFARQAKNQAHNRNLTRDDGDPAKKSFKKITLNDVNVCQADSDCIMVGEGVCSSPASIHREHQKLWEQRQEWLINKEGLVACEPSLPWEFFTPQCVNTRCEAVLLQNQAILEFEKPPQLGQPARLTFTFEFSEDKTDVDAEIFLPPGIELLEGELSWQGDLPQSTEKVLQLTLQVNETGHFRIEGTVDFATGFPLNVQDSVDLEVTPEQTFMETRPVNYWEQRIGYAVPANQDRVNTELLIEPKPALGEIFTIIYRSQALLEAAPQKMQLNLALPENAFEVISVQFSEGGDLNQNRMEFIWLGSPHIADAVELKLTLKPISTGWGPVIANTFIDEAGITDTIMADIYVGKYAGGTSLREP